MKSQKKTDKGHMVEFEFSDDAYKRLVEMQKKTGMKSKGELVRNALRLFEWYAEQKEAGKSIGVIEGDKIKEVEFSF